MYEPKAYIVIGPQGSGKGALTALASQFNPHYHPLSSGEMLRAFEKKEVVDPIILSAIKKANNGMFASDEEIMYCFKQRIGLLRGEGKLEKDTKLFLDGIPRTEKQAEMLEEIIDVQGVFLLDVDEEECRRRLYKRIEEEKRTDDTPEKIENRLRDYFTITLPQLKSYYGKDIITLNGNRYEGDDDFNKFRVFASFSRELAR